MSTASGVISYSLKGAAAATGLSSNTLERAIRTGHLRAKKSSTDEDGNPTGVWVIPAESLKAYVDAMVDA